MNILNKIKNKFQKTSPKIQKCEKINIINIDDINWDKFIIHYFVNEEIIYKYIEYIDFNLLVIYQNELSEGFLRKYKDKLNWKLVIIHQYIPLPFLKTLLYKGFFEEIDIELILKFQKLPNSFLKNNQDILNIIYIDTNLFFNSTQDLP